MHRRQSWYLATVVIGMMLGCPCMPAELVPDARSDDTANTPSYRALPAAGKPRVLLKASPIVLSQSAQRVAAIDEFLACEVDECGRWKVFAIWLKGQQEWPRPGHDSGGGIGENPLKRCNFVI